MADVNTDEIDEFLSIGRIDLSDDVFAFSSSESEISDFSETSEFSPETSESVVLSDSSAETVFLTSDDLSEGFGLFSVGMAFGILLSFIPFVIKAVVNGFKAWTSTLH